MAIQWPLLIFSILLGATSGCFVFLCVGELRGMFKDVRFAGALIALVCFAVGGCISVLHMGHPERATHLLGNLGSGLSKELFAVALMGIVSIVYLVLSKKDYPGASKVFGVIAGVLGVALPLVAGASYLIAARPAWNSLTLPLMFLGSGLAVGMTLMCGLVILHGKADESGFAVKLALIGVITMVLTAAAYVVWIGMAPYQAPSRSISRLLSGDLALMFWAGVVVIGLLVPLALVLSALKKPRQSTDESVRAPDARTLATCMFIACACSTVGAVVLRVIMYAVGTSVEQFIYR